MGRPKGGEKREKGYYVEISLSKSEDLSASCISHIYRKPLFPCVMMSIYHLRYHGVSHGRKEFVKGLRLDESGGRFCLEPAKGRIK